VDRKFPAQQSYSAAEACDIAHTAHLEGESAYPIAEHSDAIDHHIHGHGMPGVLGLRKSGFRKGETRLHEHDEKTAEQGPHEIDGNPVMTDDIR
jgi:hypothetical protein